MTLALCLMFHPTNFKVHSVVILKPTKIVTLTKAARIEDNYCLTSLQNAAYLVHASLQPHMSARAPCCYSVFAGCYEIRLRSCMRQNKIFKKLRCTLKISDFSGETFKDFEVPYFSMSATTMQLLSNGECCKLRYDTIPVKSAPANVSFYSSNSNMPNFEL